MFQVTISISKSYSETSGGGVSAGALGMTKESSEETQSSNQSSFYVEVTQKDGSISARVMPGTYSGPFKYKEGNNVPLVGDYGLLVVLTINTTVNGQ
jgi:hypothetical protein